MVVGATLHGTPVAVKVSRLSRLGTLVRHLTLLSNELRILWHVRHPSIVMFHGAVCDPCSGELALVLEWVRGVTLANFVSESLPAADRVRIMLDVCSTLSYLHSQNPCIVHGDLKSSNIMIESWAHAPTPGCWTSACPFRILRHVRHPRIDAAKHRARFWQCAVLEDPSDERRALARVAL